jgi:ribosomal protein L19
MNKNTKEKPFYVRVALRDQRVIDWYKTQPKQGKSQAVTKALEMGIPEVGDTLDIVKEIITDHEARLQDFENWGILVRDNLVNQSADVAQITQRLDQFDLILAQAQEIIEASKLKAQTSD